MNLKKFILLAVLSPTLTLAASGETVKAKPRETPASNSVDKKDSVQDEPRMLVVAFFKLMEKNNKKGMLELMTPERANGFIKDEKFFDYWLKVWKSVSVKNVGKVVPGYSREDEGRESVKVLMVYDRNGQELKDSVTVSKIGGLWYWDEN